MSQKVFVNRTLNMKHIKYIGFDMDHTLVRYNSSHFEELAHRTMKEKLVEMMGYPKNVLKLKFDYSYPIRGLVIDRTRGNVLKLSRFAAIRGSYHGLKPIDYQTQKKMYKSTYVDLASPQFDTIDTAFSISFATLFAQLVDLKDSNESHTMPDYYTIACDISTVLDQAHRDGSLKDVVKANLSEFIIKDEHVVEGLERYLKHGKKLFVLTNSDFHYTKLLLDYAIDPLLKEHDSWMDLFELVITSAQKPRFFFDDLKFLKIDPETGSMTNLDSKITPGIYQGGCANILTRDLELNPDEVLYVGDHIYGDIVRLKKDCSWRTALVVEELETEIQKNNAAEEYSTKINALMDEKIPLEIEVDQLISQRIESGSGKNEDRINDLMSQIQAIDAQLAPLIRAQQQIFNPYWGEVMRAGIEESYFAYQMERFACIYMARLSDLLELSPRTYFRSFRRPLAHEL